MFQYRMYFGIRQLINILLIYGCDQIILSDTAQCSFTTWIYLEFMGKEREKEISIFMTYSKYKLNTDI